MDPYENYVTVDVSKESPIEMRDKIQEHIRHAYEDGTCTRGYPDLFLDFVDMMSEEYFRIISNRPEKFTNLTIILNKSDEFVRRIGHGVSKLIELNNIFININQSYPGLYFEDYKGRSFKKIKKDVYPVASFRHISEHEIVLEPEQPVFEIFSVAKTMEEIDEVVAMWKKVAWDQYIKSCRADFKLGADFSRLEETYYDNRGETGDFKTKSKLL